MSYCAMENTYRDLADCVGILEQHVEEGDALTATERMYAGLLRKEARKFIAELDTYEEEGLDREDEDDEGGE